MIQKHQNKSKIRTSSHLRTYEHMNDQFLQELVLNYHYGKNRKLSNYQMKLKKNETLVELFFFGKTMCTTIFR